MLVRPEPWEFRPGRAGQIVGSSPGEEPFHFWMGNSRSLTGSRRKTSRPLPGSPVSLPTPRLPAALRLSTGCSRKENREGQLAGPSHATLRKFFFQRAMGGIWQVCERRLCFTPCSCALAVFPGICGRGAGKNSNCKDRQSHESL